MQNNLNWTSGSILRKARGLSAKNKVKLQLLLNTPGLRVNLKKVGGLFSKTDRVNRYPRTWTVRSGSNGSDSLASRSNRARPKQIGRLWGFGCAGGGEARRRRAPAAAQRRRRPNSAFPGRIRAGLGSRSIYAACVSHWWRWRACSGLGRDSWWSGRR